MSLNKVIHSKDDTLYKEKRRRKILGVFKVQKEAFTIHKGVQERSRVNDKWSKTSYFCDSNTHTHTEREEQKITLKERTVLQSGNHKQTGDKDFSKE